ncbi:hypothetical protein HMPREF0742_00231 [Rothia aeria F0184]|uniref:Uncharacterized protein n=1 Tax=Rothia aeria F0184 TaxID=888019 RepID=U7V746_9MICC|nr:hypothetical protein HMPREF0742_00231 [Rothia aeria F0184]
MVYSHPAKTQNRLCMDSCCCLTAVYKHIFGVSKAEKLHFKKLNVRADILS